MSKKHQKPHLHRKKKKTQKDTLGNIKKNVGKINVFKKAKDAIEQMAMRHMATLSAAFCHKHPEYLIFIADPKTDIFFMSHDKVHTANRLRSEDGKKLKVIRKALEFDASKFKNIQEVDHLLGVISGGLDSLRATKEAHRNKKYKRIIKQKPKGMRKFKNYSQLKKHYELEKTKKKQEESKARVEEEQIRKEQSKLDKGR